jgi:hypothetical protein
MSWDTSLDEAANFIPKSSRLKPGIESEARMKPTRQEHEFYRLIYGVCENSGRRERNQRIKGIRALDKRGWD